ncbi:pantoate--beta-alanine ligase [Pedobacter sp.]|uniref:pantoate--beta-alanine ligase n=1 Tax=Pedobacter sp. TaxID=1411316 RepID=UPI00396CD0B7
MEVTQTRAALQEALAKLKKAESTVALVPTMGALHDGHISLINEAKKEADIVVCSIFVNPTQFTDPKDLEKYPRPLEHDINMLKKAGCDVVFMPSVKEMYPDFPQPEDWYIDLGEAEFLLEGEFRKGHYQGVTQIVYKLFKVVEPDIALFGQKDYQQVLMIKTMVQKLDLPVKIITCPIIREKEGLAMSSRNVHLSEKDRKNALVLSKALQYIKDNYDTLDINTLLEHAKQMMVATEHVELDYLTIANGETLHPLKQKALKNVVALVAAKVGETRLIDNMIIN